MPFLFQTKAPILYLFEPVFSFSSYVNLWEVESLSKGRYLHFVSVASQLNLFVLFFKLENVLGSYTSTWSSGGERTANTQDSHSLFVSLFHVLKNFFPWSLGVLSVGYLSL